MIDVIYGRVVGRNECGIIPNKNCTIPVVCKISKMCNGHRSSSYFFLNEPHKRGIKC